MFVEDLKEDFYNVLLGKRVLLLVHYDVDAICACKILQELFKCDNISYTLVPVGSISELKSCYDENNQEVKFVVLVNCGGTIDLVDVLQPEEDVVFFVLDSHKPTDVCNVYSDGQVRLVYKDSEEDIPNFDDIFRDDEDENEEELSGGREGLEAAMERRSERRKWEEKRHTLMFNYTQFSYYGKPSSLVAVEVCWLLSRGSTEALWAGAVGATALLAASARSNAQALLDAEALSRNLWQQGSETARVVMETDAWLPLYRLWSLEAALRHAPLLAPHLKLHTVAGAARTRQLLADMGFPLSQARQSYRSMDVELRRSLLPSLEAAAGRLGLPHVGRASFVLKRPLAPDLAALDVVYAVMGLLEHEALSRAEGFQRSLCAVSAAGVCVGDGAGALSCGVAQAQRCLAAAASAAAATPAHAGPLAYITIHQGCWEASCLKGPLWLGVCARWAGARVPRPLLLALDSAEGCLLLGTPPQHHNEPRSLFGAAFEQAAAKSGASVSLDFFDSSVITLPSAQRQQFLDALIALLS